MSTGHHFPVDIADDPNTILALEPFNPRKVLVLAVLLRCAPVVVAFWLVKQLGAGSGLAALAAFLTYCVTTAVHLGLEASRARPPALSIEAFDEIRGAGSRALRVFRSAHPDAAEVSWHLLTRSAEGCVIRVNAPAPIPMMPSLASQTYMVPPDGRELRELTEDSDRQGGQLVVLRRPEA